ncbi:MAG TPA: DUF4340 domain-containing protein [Beijerinckiaceae bacterium]|jgi:hypothetical protein
MNVKQVVILGCVAVAAVAATAFTLRVAPTSISADRRGERVFPALLANVNEVASVTIRDNERAFTVKRRDGGFFDKDSRYPAKAEAFRDLVSGATTLSFEEAKTQDPSRYGDLGLADPGQGDKSGREVTIRNAKGDTLAHFIVGNRDTTVGGARGGVYLRFPGQPQTWLARGEARTPVPHTAWFEINLVNLGKDALARLELRGGGLDDLTMAAPSKGADIALEGAPEGRAPDTGKVMRLSFMVDPISFQDVRRPTKEPAPDARRLIATTHSGLRVTIAAVDLAEGWTRISAEATTDEAKAQLAELAPKIDGFEFKLSKNDADMLSWGMKDVTSEPKT